MKNKFDDFLKTLSSEKIKHICDLAEESTQDLRTNDRTSLGNQIAGISYTFSIELLRLYHEWLSEQL